MGRFYRELKYSMRSKGHVFFLVLLWMAATVAVWLFYLTVYREVNSSFPNESTAKTASDYHLTGTYDDMAQATDSDLKAELAFNKALHSADWMTYSEAVREDIYIQDYTGSVTALVGYEEDNCSDSKEVTKNNKTYSYVKAVWMDEQAVYDAGLGAAAGELFETPTNYYGHIYVVLGNSYKENEAYKVGSTFNIATDQGVASVAVLGFLDRGATATIGGTSICLDNYVLCPLVDLSGIYDTAEHTAEESVLYVNDDAVCKNASLDDLRYTDGGLGSDAKTIGETTYNGYKAIVIDESEAAKAESTSWLGQFYTAVKHAPVTCMAIGDRYVQAGLSKKTVNAVIDDAETTVTAAADIPAGTEYEGICLDGYIVLLRADYDSKYFPTEASADTASKTKDTKTDKDTEAVTEDTVAEDTVEDQTVTFTQSERTILMHIMYLKNRGVIHSTCTANDSERQLMSVVDSSWSDFYKENEGQSPITSYRIKEAANTDSILFRDNINGIVTNLGKYSKIFVVVGMLLLLLYYVRKKVLLKEYFTTLILTGTSNLEIIFLFVAESILLYVGTAAIGYGACFAVCKILQFNTAGVKNILGITAWMILIPTFICALWVFFTDYGKLFRRGKKD